MRCIFCKEDSTNSKGIEHIIPESFGNKKNYLPKGIVCDKCNNYFAIKIESPLFSLSFFNQLRGRNSIESKKGRIPAQKLGLYHKLIPGNEIEIDLHRHPKYIPILSIPQPFASLIFHSNIKDFLIAGIKEDVPPQNLRVMARLLGKIGLEALAQGCLQAKWEMSVLIDDIRLDSVRRFVRFDIYENEWPYYARKLYDENEKFFYSQNLNDPVDVLYQYGLYFVEKDLYILVIIKGYEFAFNLGSPTIESYVRWLLINGGNSLLHRNNII